MLKKKKILTKNKIKYNGQRHSKKKLNLVRELQGKYHISLTSSSEKSIDENWDFKKSNTKEYTHCFHSYPAMMIPQIARRIIENYGKNLKMLFDPYCGTGTSLVEANLQGLNAIGTDINPLAQLIALSKTTKIDMQLLNLVLKDFHDFYFSINFQLDRIRSVIIPNVKNIDFWFSKSTQEKLGVILGFIENINHIPIKNFFKVAFSETVREASFVKPGEFKLVRNKKYKEKDDKDVFGLIISKLSRNKQGLIEFEKKCKNGLHTSVHNFNTVMEIPDSIIKENSVDIIVTSPPYGDSRTTVAYGQYSRLSNEWLGFKDANQIDNILMGGKKGEHTYIFESDLLNDIINVITNQDKVRVKDVISFYKDYEKSINNVSTTLKKGGYACYVVGNRTVKGVNIPTDEITSQLFKQNNFTHIETIIRNIPNKRMPSTNSPSNVAGETAPTMKNEFIVVCQKN